MDAKTLFELAAKAAGYGGCWIHESCLRYPEVPEFKIWNIETGHLIKCPWNPLTDDGDALRLAVTLKLDIWQGDNESGVVIKMPASFHESHGNDPYAATRRAIVRAAAEIGAGKTGEGS